MKKDPRELFSLYLDDQAGPEERRQVEEIIRRDPEARRELENLREFSGLINASAPPLVQPPPGFREKIIHDLRTGGTGSGGGIGKLLHLKATQYWLTGAVLISLIGSLVYMDRKRNQAGDLGQPAAQEELAMELKEVELVHDRPEFKGMFTEFPGENSGVSLDDIQSHADYTIEQPAGISVSSSLEGEVYVSGKGEAGKKADRFAGKAAGASAGEILSSVEPARVTLGLESQDKWSSQSIAQAYQTQGVQAAAAPAEILRLAQQYNLNPGLLVAATLMATDYDLPEISRRLRAGLNASFGQPEEDRLLSLITALEGQASWLPRWKRILKER